MLWYLLLNIIFKNWITLKLVSAICTYFTIRKHLKIIKVILYLTEKFPLFLNVFKFLYFSLPLFFPLLAITELGEADWREDILFNIFINEEDLIVKLGQLEYYI